MFPTAVTPQTTSVKDAQLDPLKSTLEEPKFHTQPKEADPAVQFSQHSTRAVPDQELQPKNVTASLINPVPVVASKENYLESPLKTVRDSMLVPKLTKPYITEPSMLLLRQMSPQQLSAIENFSITAPKIGRVTWCEAVDLRYLNLDDVISFSEHPSTVSIYTEPQSKPNPGVGLNKPAVIKLFNCFSGRKTKDVNFII